MRKIMMMLIIIYFMIIPVNAVIINEPVLKFKVEAWLKAIDISRNGKITACGNGKALYVFNDTKISWRKNIDANCLDIAGNYIAVGDTKGYIWLFDTHGHLLWKIKTKKCIDTIAVSQNGSVVAGSVDGQVYYVKNGKILWKYKAKCCIASVDICRDGSFVVAEDLLGNVYFFTKCKYVPWMAKSSDGDLSWVYNTGWYVWKCSLSMSYPNFVRISANGNYIAINGGESHEVYLFSREGYIVWKKRVDGLPKSIAITADGSYVVVGCDSGYVYLFDRYGNLVWKFNTKSDVSSVDISSNGKFIAVGSGSRVYMFDKSSKLVWICDIGDQVEFVKVADNGRVVAGCLDGLICLFKSMVKPIASFDYNPKNPKVGEAVTFKAEGGDIVKYIWNFGDGHTMETNKAVVKHIYSKPGSYIVKLTVKNEDGLTNSTIRIITIRAVNNKKVHPTPTPTPKPTPTPTKSWLALPKIPGFKALYAILAIVIATYVVGRKH